MSIEDQLISEIKPYINKGNLEGLQIQWEEYRNETDFGREIAWDYIFQKVYLHAALKKQSAICDWLNIVFTEFDPIQQIAMRQMFSYAKHLLNKR
jgi:hypothetical protein